LGDELLRSCFAGDSLRRWIETEPEAEADASAPELAWDIDQSLSVFLSGEKWTDRPGVRSSHPGGCGVGAEIVWPTGGRLGVDTGGVRAMPARMGGEGKVRESAVRKEVSRRD
jgi:hypothetical protein